MTTSAHLTAENNGAPASGPTCLADLLSGLGNLGSRRGVMHQGQHARLVELVLLQVLAGQLLAAGGLYFQRVHRPSSNANFIMQVGSGSAARGADIADDLTLID